MTHRHRAFDSHVDDTRLVAAIGARRVHQDLEVQAVTLQHDRDPGRRVTRETDEVAVILKSHLGRAVGVPQLLGSPS